MITTELLARLQRHYIKPGSPLAGGIFVPEVGLNGISHRRCDALYVGFTSTSGRRLIGHELKVTRADWRHELDQLDKADRWADQCHSWYVVAPDESIVPREELPPEWGLMVPDNRTKTRMKVLVKAADHPNRQPSWLIVRSIMARLDTLQANDRARIRADIDDKVRNEVDKQMRDRAARADPRAEENRLFVQHLADELDIVIGWDDFGERGKTRCTREEFVAALKLLRESTRLTQGYRGLDGTAAELRQMADRLGEIGNAVTEIRGARP